MSGTNQTVDFSLAGARDPRCSSRKPHGAADAQAAALPLPLPALAFLMEMGAIVWVNNSGGLCAHTCAVWRQACERLDGLSRGVCLVSAGFHGNRVFRPFQNVINVIFSLSGPFTSLFLSSPPPPLKTKNSPNSSICCRQVQRSSWHLQVHPWQQCRGLTGLLTPHIGLSWRM